MRVNIAPALLMCACLSASAPSFAGPCFNGQLNWVGSLDLAIPGIKTPDITKVTVKPHIAKDGSWFDENFTLLVQTRSGSTISKDFYAAYGDFSLSVVSLSPNSSVYSKVMLITAVGKGTSVTKNVLTIYGINDDALKPLFSKTISGYFGNGVQWWYEINFPRVYAGSSPNPYSALMLTLHHDPIGDVPTESPGTIPDAHVICVVWGKSNFKEFDDKVCSEVEL